MGGSATAGAGNYPAQFSFLTGNPTACGAAAHPDFVVFNTGATGSESQATIVAYDNLYTHCSGAVPLVYWQYNTAYPQGGATGDGSKITTSVALSSDGAQVAFVQNNSSGAASLVLLKWKSGASLVQMSTTGSNVTPAAYHACTAPCMTVIPFANGHKDTRSAPFYDSLNDVIYAGDDGTGGACANESDPHCASLHKFTNVFLGSTPPAEATKGGWPAVTAATPLSSPVYDSVSGNVFLTSSYDGANSGGQLYRVNVSGTPNPIPSNQLTPSTSNGAACNLVSSGAGAALELDSPVVDASAQTVYAFVGNDGAGRSGIYQFPTGFAPHTCGYKEVAFGSGSASGVPLYAGNFDNQYYSSPTATGNLYVCGNTGGDPTLTQVPVANSVLGVAVTGPTVGNTATTCSPITEFYTGSADYIFMSAQTEGSGNTGLPSGCSAGIGCVVAYNVTSGAAISPGLAPSAALPVAGGTSGIVVDNSTSDAIDGSQIYFSTLANQSCGLSGTGGCALACVPERPPLPGIGGPRKPDEPQAVQ